MKKLLILLTIVTFVFFFNTCKDSSDPVGGENSHIDVSLKISKQVDLTDEAILEKMKKINEELAASGLNIAIESIEFFTVGKGRPSARLHQQSYRWVPNDPRRSADGENITYIFDQSQGATTSGLTSTQTEEAIDNALSTWNENPALKKVNIIKRNDPGSDITIYDAFYGFGGYGYWFMADIVNAGWYPSTFFEAVGGSGGGNSIIAFSVSFIFTNGGIPTDINGDNHLDQALNEVYYNDNFSWGLNINIPAVDVETVALHENGHSLDLGHFGPPPAAVMNPVYIGIKHTPLPIDQAGMNAVWSSWPNP